MKKQKGLRTERNIIKSAIKCLSEYGLHQTTFQKIADLSHISQPLVMHYFKKKEDIFPKVWDFVYKEGLQKTISKLNEKENSRDKLSDYIEISWNLFTKDPAFTKIYMQLFSLSSFDEKLKSTNTQVKRTAVNRISGLIIEGQAQGVFNKNINPFSRAKLIHIALSGLILNSISENQEFDYSSILTEFIQTTLESLK